MVVELGIELLREYNFYKEMLLNNNLKNVFNVETRDMYYTNISLEGMTDNEMKSNCIRLRHCNDEETIKIQNNIFKDSESKDALDIINFSRKGDGFRNYNELEEKDKAILNRDVITVQEIEYFENTLKKYGYNKIIDTVKQDHHFRKGENDSSIQLQEIEGLGLLLYYDNPKYYEFELNEQRRQLINDLNSYGFDFDYNIQGLDKLRTLYYGEKKYSSNQNA